MKINKRRIVIAISAVLVMGLAFGSFVSADSSLPVVYGNEQNVKKHAAEFLPDILGVTKKYGKAFKNAKKIIIFKKKEGQKKFKKYKTVKSLKKRTVDRAVKGNVQYKFQPVTKKGKKGKKTMAFTVFGLNVIGNMKIKDIDKGSVISFTVKNTSKKYNATVSAKGAGVGVGDEYNNISTFVDSNGINKSGKIVVKKGKKKVINVLFKNGKAASKIKKEWIMISSLKVKAAKKTYSFQVDCMEGTIANAGLLINETDEKKMR